MQFIKRGFYRLAGKPLAVPHFAQIEITNICNLNCKKCVRRYIEGLKFEHIEFEVFQNIVDKLKGVHTIGLTGFGEPLCYPQIFDAIKYCKNKGFEVQFTSNGLLLNEKKIQTLMESGLDHITFSVDSVDNGHPMHQNYKALPLIEKLIKVRDACHSITPRVTLQAVLIKGFEKDLFDVIDWATKRNVFRVNISRLNLNTAEPGERLSPHEEKEIFKKFQQYRKRYGIRIDCVQDQFYSGWKGKLYHYMRPFLRLETHCPRLEDFVYFDLDGNTRPCCALAKHKMGNVINRSLKEIWFGKKYCKFRQNYRKLTWCKKCDILTIKQAIDDI